MYADGHVTIIFALEMTHPYSKVDVIVNKQIRRIVIPCVAEKLTLKNVKVRGQGHSMVPIERACHKDHACQISMLYL